MHLILPVATIVLAQLAVGLRSTRASVLQELKRPYVRTAEAKGVKQQRLMLVHIMKNALNPVISTLSLQFGYLLGWVALVETVFSWPGIGLYLYNAIQNLDYAPILAITVLVSGVFILVNLVTDLVYPLLDPRLGTGKHERRRRVVPASRPDLPQTIFRRTWSRSARSRQIFVIAGGLIVAVFLVAAIAPGLLARQNPYALYAGPPVSAPAGAHLLGTDELGRDFFARMVYGARRRW